MNATPHGAGRSQTYGHGLYHSPPPPSNEIPHPTGSEVEFNTDMNPDVHLYKNFLDKHGLLPPSDKVQHCKPKSAYNTGPKEFVDAAAKATKYGYRNPKTLVTERGCHCEPNLKIRVDPIKEVPVMNANMLNKSSSRFLYGYREYPNNFGKDLPGSLPTLQAYPRSFGITNYKAAGYPVGGPRYGYQQYQTSANGL